MKAPRSKLRGIKTPKGKTRHIGNEASFGESHPFTIERTEGRYVARTRLGIEDCIVTDGNSEDEALRRHWQTLPLALLARMWGW